MVTLEKIKEVYAQNEVCMGELLANISADGLSIEDAFELYIKLMNYAEGDEFYQLAGGKMKILIGFNQEYWRTIQDAINNGTSSSLIQDIPHRTEFTCQKPNYIEFDGATYPTKSVTIFKDTSEEEEVIVSVERLSQHLLDDICNYCTREAETVDEQIYFYLDEVTFNLPDKYIIEYLEQQV